MKPPTRPVTLAVLFVSLLAAEPAARAQENAPATPLSLEEVVKLHNDRFSDDVIVTRIRKNGKAFNLSDDELVDLRKAGVSETVIRFLIDPSQPYVPPSPPPPHAETPPPATRVQRQFPPDEHASDVPSEPGLYRFAESKPVRIELKLLLPLKSGGGFGKMLKKDKGSAYLAGPTAKLRMKDQSPAFYLRLPEGKGIEETVLVALEPKPERRELQLSKQEIDSEAIRPFESVEVGTQLFRLTISKLTPGEYLFFQIGSAEPAKGTAGKGFDFAIAAPGSPARK